MGIETVTYIRKPLYVDAVRITASNFDDVATWCQGEVLQDEIPGKGTTKRYIKVRVHNPKNVRQTKAFIGDWLLYTERGYKVYTNKAFHASFDEVGTTTPASEFPDFYIDPENGWLTLEPPNEGAEALNFDELMSILKSEVSTEGRHLRQEREAALKTPEVQATAPVIVDEMAPGVEVSPGITISQGIQRELTTALDQIRQLEAGGLSPNQIAEQLGFTVEEVMTITDNGRLVHRQTPVQNPSLGQGGTPTAKPTLKEGELPPGVHRGAIQNVEDVPEQEKIVPAAAEGKRVLSVKEQWELSTDEIREMVKSGEAVLAQDIPGA